MVSMNLFGIKGFLFENRGTKQTVIRNGIWRTFALGFGKVVRLFVLLVAARWLGPNEFGVYSYALSIASLLFIVSDWGINILFVRDAQHEDISTVFRRSMTAKVSLSAVALCLSAASLLFLENINAAVFFLVSVSFFISNIRELFVVVMTAKQRSELEAYASFWEGLANILLIFAFLYAQRTATGFALFNLITVCVALFSSLILVRRNHLVTIGFSRIRETSKLLKSGLPLALFGVIGFLFFSADQIFIKHFLGEEMVGFYALATRIIYAAMILPSLLVSVVFPVLSKAKDDILRVKFLLYKGSLMLFVLGGAVASIILLTKPLILLFAPAYGNSLPIITSMAWILIFMFPSTWLDHVMVALNKQKQNFFLTLLFALLNVALNILWIPKFGMLGAVYASIVSQCANTIFTFIYVSFLLKNKYE